MKGLELAEQYFFTVGAPMIREHFPDYEGRIAAGLVGMGSECFGFDDEISRDHDWGPTFCLWLTKRDHEKIGIDLQVAFDDLPRSFAGFGPREESAWGRGRSGAFEIGQHIGLPVFDTVRAILVVLAVVHVVFYPHIGSDAHAPSFLPLRQVFQTLGAGRRWNEPTHHKNSDIYERDVIQEACILHSISFLQ